MAHKRLPKNQKDSAQRPKQGTDSGAGSGSNDNSDPPPSVKQIALAMWFAEYKKIEFPNKARTSNRHWWRWINDTLTKIDREDAHAADRDFKRLDVDVDDPVSVIGALKYRDTATLPSPEEEAVTMLLDGIHPFTIEDNLMLSQEQLDEAVKKVELGGYEIEWGSV